MDNEEPARKKCAFRCGRLLTKDNTAKEHIVINAIGGRKTVLWFICKHCNNETGERWDAELAKYLNPLSLLLGITRQRGEVPSQKFRTSSGNQVELHYDGRMDIAHPKHEVTTDGTSISIKVSARSMKEMRKMLEGMRRSHPALSNRTIDELMSNVTESSTYSPELIEYPLDMGGEKAGRSLVKSAVSLVSDAGIDPSACDLALDYLLNESGEPCFGYYYDKERDLVVNRPTGHPFHCVSVKGDSDTGTILAYVELYSLHRMVMCLSESYTGKDFAHSYAIDPTNGEEIDVDVDLDISIPEIWKAYDYEKFDYEVRESSLVGLIEYSDALGFEGSLKRATERAVEYAFTRCNAEPGEYLTDEQLKQVIADAVTHMESFLLHNAERFGYAPPPNAE